MQASDRAILSDEREYALHKLTVLLCPLLVPALIFVNEVPHVLHHSTRISYGYVS